MWNQLVIDPTLDQQKKNELTNCIEGLRSDCNSYFAKKNKQIRNLIEFNDGLFVWNPKREELCYIVIRNDNEVYGFQVSCVMKLILFSNDLHFSIQSNLT